MKVPLTWVWENDPQELPDDDHARCIAAPGERFVACGGQLFALTTRPHARLSASRRATSFSTLQMEYLGLDWPRGLAQQYWGSGAAAVRQRAACRRGPTGCRHRPAGDCGGCAGGGLGDALRVVVLIAGRIRRPEAATAPARMASSPARSTRASPGAAAPHGRPRRRSPLGGTSGSRTGRDALLARGSGRPDRDLRPGLPCAGAFVRRAEFRRVVGREDGGAAPGLADAPAPVRLDPVAELPGAREDEPAGDAGLHEWGRTVERQSMGGPFRRPSHSTPIFVGKPAAGRPWKRSTRAVSTTPRNLLYSSGRAEWARRIAT